MRGEKKGVSGDSNKKTRRIVIIVLICFAVLFLLVFLFKLFVLSLFRNAIPDISDLPEGNIQNNFQSPVREFLKSDKLTTISFTRTVAYGNTNLDINFVLSGYLREVPVFEGSEPMDTARVYVFDDDKVQWDYYGHELDDENPDCIYTYTVQGSGNAPSSTLEDPNIMEEARSLRLQYGGYGHNGDPELSVFGKLLLPLDITEDIAVHRPSEHVGAICSGYTESIVLHHSDTENLRFPLILSNVNINNSVFTGSADIEEQSYDTPGNAFFDSSYVVVTTPYVISYSDDPTVWHVAWEINLPK